MGPRPEQHLTLAAFGLSGMQPESQERYPRGQGAGWRKSEGQKRTCVITYPAQRRRTGNTLAVTGGRRGGVVEQAPEKRTSAPKGKVQSISDASSQCAAGIGEAGPSDKGGDTSDGVRG